MDGLMRDDEIHATAIERAEEALDYERENRDEAIDDLAFAAGMQWPESVAASRKAARRPCLTFNRSLQFVRQVTGDVRRAPPAISAAPVDDGADIKLAKILSGAIRNIERDSDAPAAYSNAVDGAAMCGQGHFRLVAEYEDDDSANQKLAIKSIRDHLSVVWDPFAQERSRGDARFCFVFDRMSLTEFKAEYPDADCSDFDAGQKSETPLKAEWWDGESVTVAEYWWIKVTKRRVAYFDDGRSLDTDALDDEALKTAEKEWKTTRVIETREVWSCLLSGSEMLTEPVRWPGRRIPIFTVVGQEIAVADKTVRMGLVRALKDPNRGYNFMRSASVEAMALAPKAPMTGTPDMIKGHEDVWRKAITENVDFLPFNPDVKLPGARPERVMPPQPAAAMSHEAMAFIDDMYAVTGIYPASLGARSNEVSGRAIAARQRESDTGTFLYIDNLGNAMRAMGRELVWLIPKYYDTTRVIRILGEEGDQGIAMLNVETPVGRRTSVQFASGERALLPALDAGRFDVEVKVGPTFATRREEARESLIEFVRAIPQAGAAAADLIAKNMDWPGSEELAERLKPNTQAPPPDPKAMADAAEKMARAEKARAETQGIVIDNAGKQIELAALTGQIQQAVAMALAQALPMAVQQTIAAMIQHAPQAQPAPWQPQGFM